MILKCVHCHEEKDVDPLAKVHGKSVLAWWAQNGKICQGCRAERMVSVEEFLRRFDAYVFGEREIPAPEDRDSPLPHQR